MATGDRLEPRRFCLQIILTAWISVLVPMVCADVAAASTADRTPAANGPPLAVVGETGSGIPAPVIPRISLAARASSITFSDVTSEWAWAKPAIRAVAAEESWMRDFSKHPNGTYPFRPGATETRKYFARSVVSALAPRAEPDPGIRFSDLDPSSRFWTYANIAVKRGWMTRTAKGGFLPDKAVSMTSVHRVLVLALGLRAAARSLDKLHTRDGHRIRTPRGFGTTLLGMRLFLRYNNTAHEGQDVLPWTPMPRAQVAYSLWRATNTDEGAVRSLLDQYTDIRLPRMGPARRAIVNWGVRFTGYPYIWGGEWGRRAPEPSALGGQPIPGFDCSGLTWWVLRKNDAPVWKVAPPRPYRGWSLPQRTSADMAHMTNSRLRYDDLRPGDLMFYDGDGDGVTDHVDTYVGAGFAIDSSSTPGGVTLMWVKHDWYREHFLFGRRVVPR